MKKYFTLFILLIATTTCSTASTQESHETPDHVPLAERTATKVPKATEQLSTSTAEKPTKTTAPPSVPGSMTRDMLQDRVDDWINGRIPFSDEDRLLDEVNAEEMRLGLLTKPSGSDTILYFYNLGFILVEGGDGEIYILNMVGFEDGKGEKFTFPFHNGMLSNTCNVVSLRLFNGRRLSQEIPISLDNITPMEFLGRSGELLDRVNTGVTWLDARGHTGNECVNDVDHYYAASKEITKALITFFDCPDCNVSEASPVLAKWMNIIPEDYNPRIPYLRIYSVPHW